MTGSGITKEIHNSTEIYRWNIFAPWASQLNAALSTRLGGVSGPPFSSLNMGLFVGDSQVNLRENRKILSSAMGIPDDTWVFAKQLHRNRITTADPDFPYPECDSFLIVSNRITAAVCLADCLPIVLYDPDKHIAAVCHAGWRGTAAGVADSAIKAMLEKGGRAERIVAAVGPGISSCCYPVSRDVAEFFSPHRGYPEHVLTRGSDGTVRLNLEEANVWRLRALGLKNVNIGRSGVCTACRVDEFYSYRKENGKTGRYAAVVSLR